MTNESPTVPQWICTHCFIHLVNGDCTEPDTCPWGSDDVPADAPVPMHLFEGMHITPGMLSEHHECAEQFSARAEECDCETREFSWRFCDGCGSNLGGERHAVTGWIQEGN